MGAEVRLSLQDLNGRVVFNETWTMQQASQLVPFDLNNLRSGLYILRLERNGEYKTKRLLVEY